MPTKFSNHRGDSSVRFLWRSFLFLILVAVLAGGGIFYIYGGGQPYRNLSTPPIYPDSALEIAYTSSEPLGNVTTTSDGRIFFSIHPEAGALGPKLLELVNGEAVPWPNEGTSRNSFPYLLGLAADQQNRLWLLDHGFHGFKEAQLTSYDLETGVLLSRHKFGQVAQWGSFLNDLAVSADGKFIYIADASIFRRSPAIIVYDIENNREWRALHGHSSVRVQDWIIRNPRKDMTYFMDKIPLKVGVDGLVLDQAGEYLYFGAVSHDGLFRVPTSALNNPRERAEPYVERVGTKPLSDGLSIDVENNIYITDVEHGGIARMAPDGSLETLISSPKVRWADGISYGSDGYYYFTDSAMPDMILKSRGELTVTSPYYLYRFKADIPGIPGR